MLQYPIEIAFVNTANAEASDGVLKKRGASLFVEDLLVPILYTDGVDYLEEFQFNKNLFLFRCGRFS